MKLWIQILPGSDKPIYLQIVSQISEAVARGHIYSGDKLPSVRKLASELVINPNTVARAYSVLEQTGLVTSRTGSGTFVSDPKLRNADAVNLNILTERMDTLITRAVNIGIENKNLKEMFSKRVDLFFKNTTGTEEV